MVREFATFPCFPVDDDPLSRLQALTQSLDGSLDKVVLRPETLYAGDNLRVMAIAVGDDPSRVARGAVVGTHSSFRAAAACFDVVLDKVPLFGRELAVW